MWYSGVFAYKYLSSLQKIRWAGKSAAVNGTQNRGALLQTFIVRRAFMYLIVLSPLPPVEKIKEERRCLCLKDKAETACYDQTLPRQGGEGVAGCKGIIIQAQTDIMRAHTHTHTHTHSHWSQTHRWGSFRGLSDRTHINKICRRELLDSLDFLVSYLWSRRLEAMVCFHRPLHWADLWRQKQ